MTRIEIADVDLNKLISESKVTDEIILTQGGEPIARLLPVTTEPLPSSSAQRQVNGKSSKTPAPQFRVAQEDDAMDREIAAFEAQHQALIQQFLNHYVAIYEGQVLDHDMNQELLLERIDQNYPDASILIRKVQEELPKPLLIRSPYFAQHL